MATTLYATDIASDLAFLGDDERLLSLTRAAATVASGNKATVNGPTSGLFLPYRNSPFGNIVWLTNPLQAVTISGTVTFNLWMSENSLSANVGAQCLVKRKTHAGATVSTIFSSEKGTELPLTTRAVQSWSGTPSSTALVAGDRLSIEMMGNDIGTMATGFTFNGSYGSPTASVDGDAWVQFTEALVEQTVAPYRNPMPPLIAQ